MERVPRRHPSGLFLCLLLGAFLSCGDSGTDPSDAGEEDGLSVGLPPSPEAYRMWRPLYAGAGGAVQRVYTVPGAPDRLYVLSDMEGLYRSDDGGHTWYPRWNRLEYNDTRDIVTDPRDPNHVILSTVHYAHQSFDGGATWSRVEASQDCSYWHTRLAHAANSAASIYIGTGFWKDEVTSLANDPNHCSSPSVLFSHDGGATWNSFTFPNLTSGGQKVLPNVNGLTIDPNDPLHVLAGTALGLYESVNGASSWNQVALPGTQHVQALVFSPDAKWLAVSIGVNDVTITDHVYLARRISGNWQFYDVTNTGVVGGLPSAQYLYQELQFDPNAATTAPILYAGNANNLLWPYQGTVSIDASNVPHVTWASMSITPTTSDRGWEHTFPWCERSIMPTPADWGTPGRLYVSQENSIFERDAAGTWRERYSFAIPGTDAGSYAGRGWDSMYHWYAAIDPANPSHLATGVADHFMFESLNGGVTFINHNFDSGLKTAAQSAGLTTFNGSTSGVFVPPSTDGGVSQLLYAANQGYGGNVEGSAILLASDLTQPRVIGGGATNLAGFPGMSATTVMVADPTNVDRVFLGTGSYGVWLADHLHDANPTFSRISVGTASVDAGFYLITLDPFVDNSGLGIVVSVQAGGFIGRPQVNGTWIWTKVTSSTGPTVVDVRGSALWLYGVINGDIQLSTDGGMHWQTVLTLADGRNLGAQGNPSRLAYADQVGFRTLVPLGNGDILAVISSLAGLDCPSCGYAALLGTPDANGANVRWRNITGDWTYNVTRTAAVVNDPRGPLVYAATKGNGVWLYDHNLIANGEIDLDLDNDGNPDGWTSEGPAAWDLKDSVYGQRSLSVSGAGARWISFASLIDSSNFANPRLRGWYSQSTGLAGGRITVRWLDSGGAVAASGAAAFPGTAQGGWRPFSIELTAPRGAQRVQIVFEAVDPTSITRMDHLWLGDAKKDVTPIYDSNVALFLN